MDQTQTASLTSLLVALGFGKYVAGILSLVTLWFAISPQVMAFLPVASIKSAGWYRFVYGLLAWTTGNHSANAPVPANGQPAGGIVPTPKVAAAIAKVDGFVGVKSLTGADAVHADNAEWPTTTSGGASHPVPIAKPPGAD